MDRMKKYFTKKFGDSASGSNDEHREKENENDENGRPFENPHRCALPIPVKRIYSEFTPGLGRKVPELQAAGGGFFEMHYRSDYKKTTGTARHSLVPPRGSDKTGAKPRRRNHYLAPPRSGNK